MEHSNKYPYKMLVDIHLSKYPNINLVEFNEDFNNLLKTQPLYKEDFPISGELTNLRYSLHYDGTLNVQPKRSLEFININVNITPNEN